MIFDALDKKLSEAGVGHLTQGEVDEIEDVYSAVVLLARLSQLPNIVDIMVSIQRGFCIPHWCSSELRRRLADAEDKADSRFNCIEQILNTTHKRVQSFKDTSKATAPSTEGIPMSADVSKKASPIEMLAIPRRLILFDVLEASTVGSNNVVVDGCYYDNESILPGAAKVVSKSKVGSMGACAVDRLCQEARLSLQVNNRHVVRTRTIYSFCGTLLFVMELANKGDLVNFIRMHGSLPELEARHIFRQLCNGLEYLHSRDIVHRDIKPENVLLTLEKAEPQHPLRWRAMLADLGAAAKTHQGQTLDEALGTMSYAAPEVLTGANYRGHDVDVWSLGVTLYAMVYGRLPWDLHRMTLKAAHQALMMARLELPATSQSIRPGTTQMVSMECRDLLRRMIVVDPHFRLRLREINFHPWWSLYLQPIRHTFAYYTPDTRPLHLEQQRPQQNRDLPVLHPQLHPDQMLPGYAYAKVPIDQSHRPKSPSGNVVYGPSRNLPDLISPHDRDKVARLMPGTSDDLRSTRCDSTRPITQYLRHPAVESVPYIWRAAMTARAHYPTPPQLPFVGSRRTLVPTRKAEARLTSSGSSTRIAHLLKVGSDSAAQRHSSTDLLDKAAFSIPPSQSTSSTLPIIKTSDQAKPVTANRYPIVSAPIPQPGSPTNSSLLANQHLDLV